MAVNFYARDDRCNTISITPTIQRGSTFIKLNSHSVTDPERDDTLTRIHDVSTVTSLRRADNIRNRDKKKNILGIESEKENPLTGLALARLQHRAKKNGSNGLTFISQGQQTNADFRRLIPDAATPSHKTSDMTSRREEVGRLIERPTSSWASSSGRRPKFTESGWNVEDDDFTDSRLEKMTLGESNTDIVRRASVNEPLSNSQKKSLLLIPGGNRDKLTRRASDSSKNSYIEASKTARKELKDKDMHTGHKKKEDYSNMNGTSIGSMTDSEQARMRAVSRLSNPTIQLISPSTSSMGGVGRHLPRKLDPLPVSQMTGVDMALEEEVEEWHEGRQHQRIHPSENGKETAAASNRKRFSRESDVTKNDDRNINPKHKLKPISRK